MTTIITFALKYWKYLAGAIILASAYLYHSHLVNASHAAAVKEGEASVTALWDEQKRQSLVLTSIRKDEVFSLDKLSVGVSATADSNIQKASDNEKINLEHDIAVLRERLRNATKDKSPGSDSLPNPEPTASTLNKELRIELKAEDSEYLVEVGSEGNTIADLLREAQALLISDRSICNGK